MREAAASDRFGVHELSDDPGEADLVLFVETSTCAGPYFESVRAATRSTESIGASATSTAQPT